MENFKNFTKRYLPQFLLTLFLVKSHFLPGDTDSQIIWALSFITGYRMYLNSVFDIKIQKQISNLEQRAINSINLEREKTLKELENVYIDMRSHDDGIRGMVEVNHKKVDEAIARIVLANNEELAKLKSDLGQMDLTKGIQNGKGKQIFF